MNKIIMSLLLLFLVIFISGCGQTKKQEQPITWQGVYYEHGIEENEEYGPIFNNYNACKSWALTKKSNSNDYMTCNKNCHKALDDGTPICETVVRNWTPFIGSETFDNYNE